MVPAFFHDKGTVFRVGDRLVVLSGAGQIHAHVDLTAVDVEPAVISCLRFRADDKAVPADIELLSPAGLHGTVFLREELFIVHCEQAGLHLTGLIKIAEAPIHCHPAGRRSSVFLIIFIVVPAGLNHALFIHQVIFAFVFLLTGQHLTADGREQIRLPVFFIEAHLHDAFITEAVFLAEYGLPAGDHGPLFGQIIDLSVIFQPALLHDPFVAEIINLTVDRLPAQYGPSIGIKISFSDPAGLHDALFIKIIVMTVYIDQAHGGIGVLICIGILTVTDDPCAAQEFAVVYEHPVTGSRNAQPACIKCREINDDGGNRQYGADLRFPVLFQQPDQPAPSFFDLLFHSTSTPLSIYSVGIHLKCTMSLG